MYLFSCHVFINSIKLAKPCFHGFICQEKCEYRMLGSHSLRCPPLRLQKGQAGFSFKPARHCLRQQGIHSCTQTSTHQYRRAPVQRVTDTHRGAYLVKPLVQLSISLSTSCLQTHTDTHTQQLSTCCCQEL